MNNVPNSDLEQCPELKLGWEHRVHTQWTQAAHTAPKQHAQCLGRALGCVVARTGVVSWPCRRRVTEHTRALAHSIATPPRSRYKFVSQHSSLSCAVSRAYRAVSWPILRRIAAYIAAPIVTQMLPQAMIQSLYRDTLR